MFPLFLSPLSVTVTASISVPIPTMFPLFRKKLSFLPFCRSFSSSSSSQVRKLFTRFQLSEFSSSSSSSSLSQGHSNHDDVFVWWNVDDCEVPSGVSLLKVSSSIKAAVRANGIMGRIEIRAYGDFHHSMVGAFYSAGIFPFPNIGVKENLSHKALLMDLNSCVFEHPPPAHIFLVIGDGDFPGNGVLHRLRMRNYNILLACPTRPHVALCHVATIMWEWSSILRGEDLTGKHFNYPPDGPCNSWYGNSNVPLENPFLAVEQTTSSQNVEIYRPSSDIKLGEASKLVSRQVMKILSSHSNGISMGDLRAELTKCGLPLSKCFYGHKNLSNFLVSIPHVQLHYLGKGNFWVRLVPSTTSAVKNKQKDGVATQKLHNEDTNMDRSADGIPRISSSYVSSRDVSHFEEPKSSELQQDLSQPPQPHWDNFRVSVWWDFDSCGVPSNISFLNVAPSIIGVLRANAIKGPIHIDAYGDVSQLSEINQEALFLSGIDLHHIPGGKNKNKCFLDWVSQNTQPIHLFLISGDRDFDFCGLVHRVSNWHDHILLACPGHSPVCSATTITWQWSSVLKGKYLTGKYFDNPPPDWYRDSKVPIKYPPEWYRNSKVPQENPFSTAEEPTSSQNAEIHEPPSYMKLVEVPESVSMQQVRKILSLYPNGISIGDLRSQLRLEYVTLNNLSNILASIPHVQLLYIGENNFCVRLVPSTTSTVKSKQRDVNHSRMPVLFSKDSFWDDMESFVFTPRGSRLLSRSRSREELAHKLQMHGPLFVNSLTEHDILQLVELLIAEKKWLEESPSQAFPFRLTQSIQKSSLMD